jgi:CO/xanthine dehydrogenase Mo-binding subunit
MIEEVDQMSGFSSKRALYSLPQLGSVRRGIGIALWFHGAGFTGSGERDLIKAVLKLKKSKDGIVTILASQSDIGQGIMTTLSKIAARELNIPLDCVIYENPDTAKVPDSGPTVASRSLMTVGEMVRRASAKLAASWIDGEEQEIEERFIEPDFVIPFDLSLFHGDAYPTYAWAVAAVELEVDALTGTHNVLGAWGSFDVGTPIDENIVRGQMEGGFLQGIGYASMERMVADGKGRIRDNSYADYIIPSSMDVPVLEVQLHVEKYPLGPYGAKGAGELPLVGVPAAYAEALEQALGGAPLCHIPVTAQETLGLLKKQGGGRR